MGINELDEFLYEFADFYKEYLTKEVLPEYEKLPDSERRRGLIKGLKFSMDYVDLACGRIITKKIKQKEVIKNGDGCKRDNPEA